MSEELKPAYDQQAGPPEKQDEEGIWCARCGLDLKPVASIVITPAGGMPVVPFWCPGCNKPMGELRLRVKQSPIAKAATIPGNLRVGR